MKSFSEFWSEYFMPNVWQNDAKAAQNLRYIEIVLLRWSMLAKNLFFVHLSKSEILMAIKKLYTKTKPVAKVTFSFLAKQAQTASVVGDFNDWNAESGKLEKLKNGTFKGVFELPKEASFEFRYIVDGEYANDPEADGLRWNDFAGAENSVLNT